MSVENAQCDHPKHGDIRNSSRVVSDAMVARPKTMSASATIGDLRRTFDNPHVISALLVDGPSFAGIVNRSALAGLGTDMGDDTPARDLADTDVVTVRPSTPLADAVAILDADESRRLVVVADDGTTLAGLLCLDQSRTGFCQ
jgi:CBS domain-containing protein